MGGISDTIDSRRQTETTSQRKAFFSGEEAHTVRLRERPSAKQKGTQEASS